MAYQHKGNTMAVENRDKLTCVKLRPSELQLIKDAANKASRTISDYIREAVLNKVKRS